VWGARVAGEGVVDGVDGANAVAAGADEVGADAAVSGEGGQGVPVAEDSLMSFGAFEGLLTGIVCSGHGEVSGEGPDLLGLVVEAFGEVVSGVDSSNPAAVRRWAKRCRARATNPVDTGAPSNAAIRCAVRSRGTLPSLTNRIAAALTFGP